MGGRKNIEENFDIVCTALTQIFERSINDDYHTVANNMVQRKVWLPQPKRNIGEALTPVWKT